MKTITLSKSWGYSVKDAIRIANLLGITNIKFAPARVRNTGPAVAAARLRDYRGARYCAADRKAA